MNLIDYILNLFRSPDPDVARQFVANPVQAASTATGQAVSAAQLQTAYTAVAPVSAAYGGGDPIVGMQRAVANHNNLEFAPTRVLSPDTEIASRNNTEFLSNNDPQVLSPHAGESVQQGGVNLDFSDMTFGDRNEASEGSVINTGNAGNIDNTNVKGDGNVVGDDNENVNTGKIEDSNVNIGEDNEIDDDSVTAGGDAIVGNEGHVINKPDLGGGDGGGAVGGDGGGGLIGVGNDGGNATGGAGGGGGSITINDNDTTTNNVDGNQTTVDSGGGNIGSVSGGTNTEDNSVDNSIEVTDSFNDDHSVDNSGQVNTTVDVDTTVDAGIF